jgi:hypothetical protein
VSRCSILNSIVSEEPIASIVREEFYSCKFYLRLCCNYCCVPVAPVYYHCPSGYTIQFSRF